MGANAGESLPRRRQQMRLRKGLVEVITNLSAGPQPPEPVQQRDGLLGDPSMSALLAPGGVTPG